MPDRVMIGIASVPERATSLREVVKALAPQAAQIHVSLNRYPVKPAFLARYDNVEATLRPRNRGDGEKFAQVDDWEGYVLTCDDDIGYPPDYVETMIAGVQRYDGRRLASLHGGTILGWAGSPVSTSTGRVRCLGFLPEDKHHINLGGTGVLAYDSRVLPVYSDVFRQANMADVQLACHARTMGIPYVALAHQGRPWLKDILPAGAPTIYLANRERDESERDTHDLREQEINRFDWCSPPPARPHVRVTVATCNRPDLCRQLLDDLEREAQWVDLEVAVYEDHSLADYSLPRRMCRRRGWTWKMFEQRLGRTGYWKLFDRWMKDARESKAEWFLMLNDDHKLVRHAIPRAISTWYRLDNPATLQLWRVRSFENRASWTGKKPVIGPEALECFNVDGPFLCRRRTLEELEFTCHDPAPAYPTGSGVGRQLSQRLDAAGMRMYRVKKSLALNNDGGVSEMNVQERARNPIVCV